MDEILEVCRKHNIKVIEDATESLGAKYNELGQFSEALIYYEKAFRLDPSNTKLENKISSLKTEIENKN